MLGSRDQQGGKLRFRWQHIKVLELLMAPLENPHRPKNDEGKGLHHLMKGLFIIYCLQWDADKFNSEFPLAFPLHWQHKVETHRLLPNWEFSCTGSKKLRSLTLRSLLSDLVVQGDYSISEFPPSFESLRQEKSYGQRSVPDVKCPHFQSPKPVIYGPAYFLLQYFSIPQSPFYLR